MAQEPFWRTKSLEEMNGQEWESLCDGCGKCCLVKLEDVDDGTISNTDVTCFLLDTVTCRCRDYTRRFERVPECIRITPETISSLLAWLPGTCAYRLLHEGHDLPDWHPLVSGNPDSVHRAGVSLSNRVVSEADVADEDLPDHVVDWTV